MDENFVCHLESNAGRFASKTALAWEGGKLTWSELDQLGSGFAGYLSRQGVRAGDRVAIVLPIGWDFVVAFVGVLKLGATAAPLNPLLKSEELAKLIADLRPKQIVDQVTAEPGSWDTPAHTSAPALILYTSGSTGRPREPFSVTTR